MKLNISFCSTFIDRFSRLYHITQKNQHSIFPMISITARRPVLCFNKRRYPLAQHQSGRRTELMLTFGKIHELFAWLMIGLVGHLSLSPTFQDRWLKNCFYFLFCVLGEGENHENLLLPTWSRQLRWSSCTQNEHGTWIWHRCSLLDRWELLFLKRCNGCLYLYCRGGIGYVLGSKVPTLAVLSSQGDGWPVPSAMIL